LQEIGSDVAQTILRHRITLVEMILIKVEIKK
jgi:hypothetical protein